MHRRDALRLLAAAPAAATAAAGPLEVRLAVISSRTVRLTVAQPGATVQTDGTVLPEALAIRQQPVRGRIRAGDLTVEAGGNPLTVRILQRGKPVQQFEIDSSTGAVAFSTAAGPVLGLGEGGPQFDRRGSFDEMKNGQSGYKQRTYGARVPVPLVLCAGGWSAFFHQPAGRFDFTTRDRAVFLPSQSLQQQPLDLFFTVAAEPAALMREYARISGLADMPPLWSFGYQQSHRTLAGREEVMQVARTFREKKLPCDVLIYLGTGFCPSGWNTGHGSFTFNPVAFPDPATMFADLHELHYRIALHTVYRNPSLRGAVADACATTDDASQAGCYWQMHRKVSAVGVDGWWPDEGDQLDVVSRLTRDRLYYDGPLAEHPNVRPFALHRNGAAGTQRFGAFLWSGDVSSTWETLRLHVPIAVNTSLSGLPFWGTDTGGFVPTKELTGELYVRWFQFSAFCPLFRSHGRTWKLRLPWQWNSGEMGPSELTGGGSADPDASELHNAAVEPICRKYLELRYRLMPYLYSAVRECHETGMPVMRALWLHYPGDPVAVLRGDEYLWGRDMLVAPVVERGAASRAIYLPAGSWYDFWTEQEVAGGREFSRPVDLETIPVYVRAGAILPFGPVRQYTAEPNDAPIELTVYPGADGRFVLYEDDGVSYNFRRGEYTKILCEWHDRTRQLTLKVEHSPTPGTSREFLVRILPEKTFRRVRAG